MSRRRQGTVDRFPTLADTKGPILELEDLKTYFHTDRGLLRAVDGVSFVLDRGETMGVVGESGSGKTVLSRSIMGLLSSPNMQRSGAVRFAGHDLSALSPNDLRDVWGTQIAMVFQDPMTALNPVVRVERQITESLRIRLGLDRKAAHDTAVALLTSVGIPSPEQRLRNFPHELSGGMRQRVMIAIALACGPKLLLADEPTTGLDVTVQAQILDLLAEQQQERAMAMILVTHDLGVVANRTDNIVVMYAGKVVEQAPTEELFAHTRMPYTEALMRSIPRLDQPSHSRLQAIPGRPPDPRQPARGLRCFAPASWPVCPGALPTGGAAVANRRARPLRRLLVPGRVGRGRTGPRHQPVAERPGGGGASAAAESAAVPVGADSGVRRPGPVRSRPVVQSRPAGTGRFGSGRFGTGPILGGGDTDLDSLLGAFERGLVAGSGTRPTA